MTLKRAWKLNSGRFFALAQLLRYLVWGAVGMKQEPNSSGLRDNEIRTTQYNLL